jgi:hypothetical protein
MPKTIAEKIKEAVDPYAFRVGMVAYSWNRLVETLGIVFVDVTKMDYETAQAIWYTFDNDRSQIKMLQAAIGATPKDRWLPRFPQARKDLEWLAERSVNLVDARNNAIHAPCIVELDKETGSVISDPLSGHERAKRLHGKSLEDECDYCTSRAGGLEDFAHQILIALRNEPSAWPGRPVLRERRQKSKPHPPTNRPPTK